MQTIAVNIPCSHFWLEQNLQRSFSKSCSFSLAFLIKIVKKNCSSMATWWFDFIPLLPNSIHHLKPAFANLFDHYIQYHMNASLLERVSLASSAEWHPGNPECCSSLGIAAEGDSIRKRSLLSGSTFHRHHLCRTGRRLVKYHQLQRIIFTFYGEKK